MDEELTITTMDFIENKELSAGCIEQGYMTKKCVFSDFQNNFLKKKKKGDQCMKSVRCSTQNASIWWFINNKILGDNPIPST